MHVIANEIHRCRLVLVAAFARDPFFSAMRARQGAAYSDCEDWRLFMAHGLSNEHFIKALAQISTESYKGKVFNSDSWKGTAWR